MANVEIYTWRTCPFCLRAKALLDRKGIDYIEHCIDGDEDARNKMVKRTGGPRSVPQIFVDDKYVGDCSGIYDLDAQGKLDPILAL
ncbi:MAG: glutaredoxin 3 [Roseofilum sp. SBFL]|uniref:glutaredoxin 3 n=1 Tax=unclassified Roseofilum TaxID=2620099 RepID=UPI001B1248CF|nr:MULTISPECIES: glutaredoxin 3 [unclassified Roseofilum]MBP0012233.1 glutaredoxin 3 [Roseofilum sp. SID3]MBP0025766.1 glutaredoxin 3 [Roseofilum sp. SID2]MBP0036848.1 glutaredoxin 3 [Roseofilum sp. SID1]MBP0044146.1 glutaredoxin 3 [Roseofilum sp. SBFL]